MLVLLVIVLVACLISVLRQHPERIDTLQSFNANHALEMSTGAADYEPSHFCAFQVYIPSVMLEFEITTGGCLLVFHHKAKCGLAL